jgi:hypothetical protein
MARWFLPYEKKLGMDELIRKNKEKKQEKQE